MESDQAEFSGYAARPLADQSRYDRPRRDQGQPFSSFLRVQVGDPAATPSLAPVLFIVTDTLRRKGNSAPALLREVVEHLGHADGAIRVQASRLAIRLSAALGRFELPTDPVFAATVRDDQSLLIEWAHDDRRLSFSLERNPAESSWNFVRSNGDSACGDLESAAIVGVVSTFLGIDPA